MATDHNKDPDPTSRATLERIRATRAGVAAAHRDIKALIRFWEAKKAARAAEAHADAEHKRRIAAEKKLATIRADIAKIEAKAAEEKERTRAAQKRLRVRAEVDNWSTMTPDALVESAARVWKALVDGGKEPDEASDQIGAALERRSIAAETVDLAFNEIDRIEAEMQAAQAAEEQRRAAEADAAAAAEVEPDEHPADEVPAAPVAAPEMTAAERRRAKQRERQRNQKIPPTREAPGGAGGRMRHLVQVETEDGWATLNRGQHGQPRRELGVLAEQWRVSLLFGDARIRVAEDRPERQAHAPVARIEVEQVAEAFRP